VTKPNSKNRVKKKREVETGSTAPLKRSKKLRRRRDDPHDLFWKWGAESLLKKKKKERKR